jgi:hypothetical protein
VDAAGHGDSLRKGYCGFGGESVGAFSLYKAVAIGLSDIKPVPFAFADVPKFSAVEVYDLENYFENCDGYATVSECYCGERLLWVDVGGEDWIVEINTTETSERTDSSIIHTKITKYGHFEIFVIETTEIFLIDGEWIKSSVTKSVKLNEQITLSTTVPYSTPLTSAEMMLFVYNN